MKKSIMDLVTAINSDPISTAGLSAFLEEWQVYPHQVIELLHGLRCAGLVLPEYSSKEWYWTEKGKELKAGLAKLVAEKEAAHGAEPHAANSKGIDALTVPQGPGEEKGDQSAFGDETAEVWDRMEP